MNSPKSGGSETEPLLPTRITLLLEPPPPKKEEKKPDEDVKIVILKHLMEYAQIFNKTKLLDKFYMFLGSIATIVHGLCFLALGMILSDMTQPIVQLSLFGTENATLSFGNESFIELLGIANSPPGTALSKSEFIAAFKEYIWLLIYVGAIVLISSFLQTIFFEWSAENQSYNWRYDFTTSALAQGLSWHETNDATAIGFTLTDGVEKVREGSGHKFSLVLQYVTICFVQVFFALSINWKLTMIFLTISPLPALLVKFLNFGKKLSDSANQEQSMYALASKKCVDFITNIRNIMIFSQEPHTVKNYRKALSAAAGIAVGKYEMNALGVGLFIVLLFGSYVVAFEHGCQLLAEHTTSPTQIYMVFFTVTIAVFSLGQILPWISTISSAKSSAGKLDDLIPDAELAINALDDKNKHKIIMNVSGQMSFKNVKFAYPPHKDINVLDDFSMDIKSGQTVGIIGKSNQGKTTVTKMMSRFYDPDSGSISIDGVNIQDLDLCWFRRLVALVPQKPGGYLEDTVLQNIRAGMKKEDIPKEKIQEVAELFDIHNYILSLENGYDTIMGLHNWRMPDDKMHRINIVRALVRNPMWLILDEVLEKLPVDEWDQTFEEILNYRKNSQGPGQVTIVVAHKTKILQNPNVEKIYFVDDGKVLESGTFLELIKKKGHFYEMYQEEQKIQIRSIFSIQTIQTFVPQQDAEVDKVVDDAARLKQIYPGFWKMLRITNFTWADRSLWITAALGCIITGLLIPAFALFYVEIFLTFGSISAGLPADSLFWTKMLIGLAVAAGIGYWMRALFSQTAGEHLILNLRVLAVMSIMARPLTWFEKDENAPCTIADKISEGVPTIKAALDNRLSVAVSGLVSIVGSIVVSLIFGWQLSFAIILCVQIIILLAVLQVICERKLERIRVALLNKASLIFKKALAEISTVQAFVMEEQVLQKYVNFSDKLRRKRQKFSTIFATMYALSETFIYVTLGITFWLGCYLLEENAIDPLAFFKVYLALVFGLICFGNFSSFVPDYSKAELAFARVIDLIEGEGELDIKRLSQLESTFVMKGGIKLQNVEYCSIDLTVMNCSFEVPDGKSLAICDGKYKKSMFDLILRLYEVKSGSIFLGGQNIRTMSMAQLRESIGYVPASPTLISGTILDNIAFGWPKPVDKKNTIALNGMVNQIAKEVGLEKFIEALQPKGLDTEIDSNTLGMNQLTLLRIGFARALIRNPKILLIEDPTENFNVADATIIINLIQKVKIGKTCLITTKEPRVAKIADLVGILDYSRFRSIGVGTHEQLAADKEDDAYFQFMSKGNQPPPPPVEPMEEENEEEEKDEEF